MEERLELTRQAVDSHFWFRGFRRFVVPVVGAAAAGCDSYRILDCGSGTGDNLRWLGRHGRVVGVDLSLGGVRHTASQGYHGVNGDVSGLPFRDASFDMTTSFDVLQQVEDDLLAVREMARVLRPGGRVVLTLAALGVLHGDHNVVWDERRRYTRGTARALVVQAGLEPEQISFLFAVLFPVMLVSRTLQRATRRFRHASRESDIRVPPAPLNALLSWALAMEALLARFAPMPVGSTLLVVARKPSVP